MLRADWPPILTLRHALAAGERLDPALRAAWTARTGTDLHEAMGASEISTFLSGSPSRPAPYGTAGFPQPGRHLAILGDDGPCRRDSRARWRSGATIRGCSWAIWTILTRRAPAFAATGS
ncbi:hypothetical protein FLP41_14600 [Paracoccus marcusii]|uniref:hypothetical protein n=1 Tax=Paracoccus marcusii TaxID=59779 RepID=UPI002ECFBEEB|nr:hypothetical protein FLP41_14600 [Paracoccus marcusii]